jgi:hypothetical protein
MPALNFRPQFADLVSSGQKTQTIRQVRKCPIKVGDTLWLYTGMRTKQCRLLADAVVTDVQGIQIIPAYKTILFTRPIPDSILMWAHRLKGKDLKRFSVEALLL